MSTRLPLLALLAAVGCGGAYRPPPDPAPRSVPQIITGTCRGYDYDARTLDVVTGTSFALRSMLFKTHDNTAFVVGGRRASIADMRANLVVEVEYRVTAEGNVADRITVLMDANGMRSP